MWYFSGPEIVSIGLGAVASMLAISIVGLWVFFPSRIVVAIVSLLGLLLPPLYSVRLFARIDFPFLAFSLLSVGLLVSATQLRRNLKR